MNNQSITESKDIQKAIEWVRSWYNERYQQKDNNGKPYLTDTEYTLIQDRLNNLEVIVSKYPLLTLYQEAIEGRLHFRKSLPEGYALTETETKTLMEFSKDMIGMYSPLLREPAIFLNPEELLNSNLHWTQNEGNTIHGSLSKAAVHEITHAATSGFPKVEEAVKGAVNISDGQPNEYYNLPVEIYARIAELRYSLNADPTHHFTIEEVRQLRAKVESDKKQYAKDIKAIGKQNIKNLDQLPLDGKVLDHQLFNRYTDEEIMHLLNDTAYRDPRELEQEHRKMFKADRPMITKLEAPRLFVQPQIQKGIGQMHMKV